jgi:hypothetical protein
MKHDLLSLEVNDGILAPILQVRCTCGWSSNRFLNSKKATKSDKREMTARHTEHARMATAASTAAPSGHTPTKSNR